MAALKKSKQPISVLRAEDQSRNERQKTMLLLEYRHILKDNCSELIEQSQRLITRTRKLIAASRQSIKKQPKRA